MSKGKYENAKIQQESPLQVASANDCYSSIFVT